jgi:regulator of protease activity HflC (stomatin/prohibitin superfamily)
MFNNLIPTWLKPGISRNWLIAYLLAITLLGYVLITIIITEPYTLKGFEIKWQNLWLAIAIGYLLASVVVGIINPIPPDRMGVRIVLGIATDELSSGPPFAPPGLVEIETTPRTIEQREFPAEPQFIFRSKDEEGVSDNPPPRMTHPLRVTFGEKPLTDDEAKNLFRDFYWVWPQGTTELIEGTKIPFDATVSDDDGLVKGRLTAEVAHVARLRVWKLKALIEKIPADPTTGRRIDEVFRQIEDEQVAVINTILPKMTVGQALRNLPWINAVLFQKVCQRIQAEKRKAADGTELNHSDGHSEEWGIDLEGSFIKSITFNRSVNQAIALAIQNVFNAQAAVNLAVGERQQTILKGEGAAQAASDLERKTLEGRAAGLEAIKKVASTQAGRAAIGAEVAREVAQGGNTIVVGTDGVTQILGVAAAAAKGMKGTDQK